ncbi:hypothetical protein C8T65DRAFT_648099 [Cerioporus squamosus]|nr:hypothetical protein C8T65DRAFT_648099 [Cerioporus squamosus]
MATTTNLAAHNPAAAATAQTAPSDLVLLIFIHGFKGDDSTFGEFPQRLEHVLTESLPNATVESVTKGELNAAVVRFADWLTDLTVRKEVAHGGAGCAKIVLCGHSMGGLLAADALIEFVRTRPDKKAPLWPNIVACLAYDTPYLGLHPHIFKNSATQAAEYVRTASTVLSSFKSWRAKTPSGAAAAADAPPPVPPKAAITAPPAPEASAGASLWQKWAAPAAYTLGGALFAGAAAGAAYYKREDIGASATWVTDHLRYVGNLWNKNELEARLDRVLQIESMQGVLFQMFYSYLPPSPPNLPSSRTFAVLPHRNSAIATHFAPNPNSLATDEIQAHTGMFNSKTNDGYYNLGLDSAKLIREAVLLHRSVEASSRQPAGTFKQAEEVKEAVHSSATAEAARAAEAPPAAASVASAASAPPPPSVETVVPPGAEEQEEESEEEEDDDEEEEEAKPAQAAPKKDVKPAAAEEEDDSEEDNDDEDDEEEDEDEDEEDEEDDEEEDDDDEDDEDEEEETQPPTKKA